MKVAKNKKTGKYVALKLLNKHEIMKAQQIDHVYNPLGEGPQQQGAARGNHGSHRVRQRPTDQSAESELARTDIPVAERVVGE